MFTQERRRKPLRATAEQAAINGRTSTTRERLIAGARDQIEAGGVAGLTVASICEAAGLSRATFYVHFSNRDDVLLAVFLEEAEAVIDGSREVAAAHAHFGEMCVETLLHGMQVIRENPWLHKLFADESASVTARLASTSDAFMAGAHAFWEPLVVGAQERGEVRAGLDTTSVIRWLLRIFVSYLEEDDAAVQPPEVVRHELQTFLLPSLLSPGSQDRADSPQRETDHLLRRIENRVDGLNTAVANLRRHVGSPD